MTTREELDGKIDDLLAAYYAAGLSGGASKSADDAPLDAALDAIFARLHTAEEALEAADAMQKALRTIASGVPCRALSIADAYDTARAKHRAAAKGDAT